MRMRGGFLSGTSVGILDLETSIQRHQQAQMSIPPHTHHHHMNVMTGFENDHCSIGTLEAKGSTPKGIPINYGKGKGIAPVSVANNDNNNTSDEDEPSYTEDENFSGAKGKKGSPWQRMKWTDNVVRLLIAVVACVGDDGTLEGVEGLKRKSGILQKKGKWKTVSKIMISKGCFVSPQQCEDKFNDLNKRYKRLNEILGRGTTCRVVENPALMDSMPHLSAKMKDDVKKILSSKHLFYQEMCAYHNGKSIPNCHDIDLQGYFSPLARSSKDNNGSEEEEAEENEDFDDDELDNEEYDNVDVHAQRMGQFHQRRKVNQEDCSFWPQDACQDSFEVEIAGIFEDPTKSLWEQKEWIKNRMLQLQEQRVTIMAQGFELEKQRFKWLRYSSKKGRDLENSRLENERLGLENERMVLELKQKELELDSKRPEASLDPASLGIDRLQGRDQIELGRNQ
ncbi:uncharacterized protein LOC117919466 isoform X2 [Vitis riparia]|uniref:uncharacterized protein LOC117919466 isoform X2 n=1 Tax=Vitis riparia TaxID=96939 RepID=UPI00155A624A|nr:uncharacterized protein LOC117919466 isoform X2 [Vitis riparia]